MRVRQVTSGLTVNAIAGCHVVVHGFNVDARRRRGLQGFAVRRTDPTEGETF